MWSVCYYINLSSSTVLQTMNICWNTDFQRRTEGARYSGVEQLDSGPSNGICVGKRVDVCKQAEPRRHVFGSSRRVDTEGPRPRSYSALFLFFFFNSSSPVSQFQMRQIMIMSLIMFLTAMGFWKISIYRFNVLKIATNDSSIRITFSICRNYKKIYLSATNCCFYLLKKFCSSYSWCKVSSLSCILQKLVTLC